MSIYTKDVIDKVEELLNIGIALSAEKNNKLLLERILTEARKMTNCDAGTLYFLEEGLLHFKIIQNDTLKIYKGGNGEAIDLPPVTVTAQNVSGYCALKRQIVNIADVYEADFDGIDFSGPKRYDAMTGYRTQSMLVVPLENYEGKIIGVLQLLNAKENEGSQQVVPFEDFQVKVVSSLASQAAVALTNRQFVEELNAIFNAFVEVITTAIDARSPYNANHTRNIAQLAEKWAHYLNEHKEIGVEFSGDEIEQLVMAAWLHDIGKVAVPLEVMDKPTRLAGRFEVVMCRMRMIREQRRASLLKAAMLENHDSIVVDQEGVWKRLDDLDCEMDEAEALITKADNPATFVDNDIKNQILCLASKTYLDSNLNDHSWLEPNEIEALTVMRGTLTDGERSVMEGHVGISEKMLDKIPFNEKFKHVKQWAIAHHEFLDGTGYPRKLEGDHISKEVRILTILDIFDALTASDRPYKKAMPTEKAFLILEDMAERNKLDRLLLKSFEESKVWMKEL